MSPATALAAVALFVSLGGVSYPVALSVNGPDGSPWTALAYATAPTADRQLVNVVICG